LTSQPMSQSVYSSELLFPDTNEAGLETEPSVGI
jgi:hypothetical protein